LDDDGNSLNDGPWNKAEKELYLDAVRLHGHDTARIVAHVGSKTLVAVRAFWGRQRKRLGLDKLVEEHAARNGGVVVRDDTMMEGLGVGGSGIKRTAAAAALPVDPLHPSKRVFELQAGGASQHHVGRGASGLVGLTQAEAIQRAMQQDWATVAAEAGLPAGTAAAAKAKAQAMAAVQGGAHMPSHTYLSMTAIAASLGVSSVGGQTPSGNTSHLSQMQQAMAAVMQRQQGGPMQPPPTSSAAAGLHPPLGGADGELAQYRVATSSLPSHSHSMQVRKSNSPSSVGFDSRIALGSLLLARFADFALGFGGQSQSLLGGAAAAHQHHAHHSQHQHQQPAAYGLTAYRNALNTSAAPSSAFTSFRQKLVTAAGGGGGSHPGSPHPGSPHRPSSLLAVKADGADAVLGGKPLMHATGSGGGGAPSTTAFAPIEHGKPVREGERARERETAVEGGVV
jgi:hypothetical protein